jgi:hypothetical protein
MNNREQVLALLRETRTPLCDACIRRITGINPHAQVNQIANLLASQRLLTRARAVCSACGKLAEKCNSAEGPSGPPTPVLSASEGSAAVPPQTEPQQAETAGEPAKLWYWEGHVQAVVVEWLKVQGWEIVQAVDTAAKTPGVDIIARRPPDKELWVTVKGFREKSKYVQARHWFASAIFDLVTYRDQKPELYLAVALPDGYATYRGLAAKVGWLKKTMPFTILWVGADGTVRSE